MTKSKGSMENRRPLTMAEVTMNGSEGENNENCHVHKHQAEKKPDEI